MSGKKSLWNSLEVAKLLVSILLPIALVVFGYMTQRALQENQRTVTEALQENERKFTEALQDRQSEIRLSEAIVNKRQEIYDEIRIPLNNIYCYIEEVGKYKSMTPATVTADRRSLHATMHTQRAYWSPALFSLYLKYMDEIAFKTRQGVNKDARIQDSPGQKRDLDSWKEEWDSLFTNEEHPLHESTYNALLDALASEIGANVAR